MEGSSRPALNLPMLSCASCIALLRRHLREVRNALLDLGTEMTDQALDRPGRRVAQGADGMALDLLAHFLQQVDLRNLGVALHHPGHHPPHPACAFTAGGALAAAFMLVEISQALDRLDHV